MNSALKDHTLHVLSCIYTGGNDKLRNGILISGTSNFTCRLL